MPKNIFTGMKRWGLRELNSSFVKDIPKQLQEKKNARLDNIFLTIVVLYIIVVLGYYPVLTVLGIGTQSTILYSLGFVLVVFGIVSRLCHEDHITDDSPPTRTCVTPARAPAPDC